jgi:hypothetical protein
VADSIVNKSNWKARIRPNWIGYKTKKGRFIAPRSNNKADAEFLKVWRHNLAAGGFETDKHDGSVFIKLDRLEAIANALKKHFAKYRVRFSVIDVFLATDTGGENILRVARFEDDFVKKVHTWEVHMRPYVSEKCDVSSGSRLWMPVKGIAPPMEWWHFQYNMGASADKKSIPWHELMGLIGWTKEGLNKLGYKVPLNAG